MEWSLETQASVVVVPTTRNSAVTVNSVRLVLVPETRLRTEKHAIHAQISQFTHSYSVTIWLTQAKPRDNCETSPIYHEPFEQRSHQRFRATGTAADVVPAQNRGV